MDNPELIRRLYAVEEELHDFFRRKEHTDQTLFRIEEEIDSLQRTLSSLEKARAVYQELIDLGLKTREDISDFIFSCGEALLAQGEEKKSEAYSYFEFAADFGGTKAKIGFAKALIYGTLGIHSPDEGIDILRRLAKEGVPEACFLLYVAYESFPEIIEAGEAKRFYEKAAELGYRLALSPLPEDFDTRPYTERLLARYQEGDMTVCYALSKREDLEEERQAEFFALAMQNGDPAAEREAGQLLLEANEKTKAIEMFERAGDHGLPEAYLHAAKALEASPHFYECGLGAAQEDEYRLYLKASEKDVPEALSKVGLSKIKGYMSEKDIQKGADMLEKAIRLGERFDAPCTLGCEYESGQNLPRDYVKAIACYKKAAERGNLSAIMALARLYEEGGEGLDPDPAMAARYRFIGGIGRD